MAKSIMVQGTTSNAGKSFLAAALCRIFKQDGHSVAPFKSQNMALNSFITADGLEMGRAQVMQAEAAGIAPTVEMNPILLKPTNDTGSQVIVNGEVRGVMSARDYFAFKKNLVPDVMKAYNALADSGKYLKIYNCIARQPLTAEEFVPEMPGDKLRALNASLGIPGSRGGGGDVRRGRGHVPGHEREPAGPASGPGQGGGYAARYIPACSVFSPCRACVRPVVMV